MDFKEPFAKLNSNMQELVGFPPTSRGENDIFQSSSHSCASRNPEIVDVLKIA